MADAFIRSMSDAGEEDRTFLSINRRKESITPVPALTIDVSKLTQPTKLQSSVVVIDQRSDCDRACDYCCRAGSWARLVLSVCLISDIIFLCWTKELGLEQHSVLFIVGVFFFVGCFVPYVCTVLYSETWDCVRRALGRTVLDQHLHSVKNGTPAITWLMKCYHEDPRNVTAAFTENSTNLELLKNKIVTWSGSKTFEFKSWQDITPSSQIAEFGTYHFITFHKHYLFADKETKAAYEFQKEAFINANKHRDHLYIIEETFDVEEYQESMLVKVWDRSFRASWIVHAVMAGLFLAYPWSIFVKAGERRTDYRFVKVLSTSHDRIGIAETQKTPTPSTRRRGTCVDDDVSIYVK